MKWGFGFVIGVWDLMKWNKELLLLLLILGFGVYNIIKFCFMKVLVLVFLMVGRIIISDCNVYSFGFGVYNVDGGLKYNRIGLYGLVVRRGKVCEFRISFGFCNNMRLMLLFMFGVWFYV